MSRPWHSFRRSGWRSALYAAIVSCSFLWLESSVAMGRRHSIPDLIEQAELVVVGTVTESLVFRRLPSGSVYTAVTLQLGETLKGPWQTPIEILVPGGRLEEEDLAVWVSHQPRFFLGERVLAALRKSPFGDDRFLVLGGAEGKVRLHEATHPKAGDSALSFFQRVAPPEQREGSPSARLKRSQNPFDFLSIAVHEQGHFAGPLGDLYNNAEEGGGAYIECIGSNNQEKTMYGVIGPGSTRPRDLEQADRLGMRALYGGLFLPLPTGSVNENLFAYFCASGSPELTCSSAACEPRVHWASIPVAYKIRTSDFSAEQVQLLQRGLGVWNRINGSSFSGDYRGDTEIDVASVDDNVNVFRVSDADNSDDNAVFTGGALAVTSFAWFISSGEIADSDITFNHRTDFQPALPVPPTPTPDPDTGDGGGCGTITPPATPLTRSLGLLLLLTLVTFALARIRGSVQPHEAPEEHYSDKSHFFL